MPGRTFTLFVVSGENRTCTIEIDEDANIQELRRKVTEKMAESGSSAAGEDDLRIHFAGKDLRSESPSRQPLTLKDYNLHNEATMYVVMRLPGGSDDPSPIVQPKMYDSEVQLTDKPDMFTLDDEEGGQRAEMPCGHVISPESLTAYCRSLLTAGKYEFFCPYKAKPEDPYCNELWELFTVKRLAVLTPEEIKAFEKKMAENYLRKAVGIQSCPRCKLFCERKSKTDQRVRCLVCKTEAGGRYEFCWFCLKTWLTNEFKNCGNSGCTGEDPRLRVIKNCPKKKVVGVECPAIRACPTCGLLIEHKEACKQMTCTCGQKFCFICLKKANGDGIYQCGVWNFKCEVAPVQTSLSGN
ncbi:uncharacterized protein DDB_G0292642-like [Mercenaria mercenaria]|uniref:uncharacterized protein DDB_G0292642-like n=1 Tax=Mercenaria mercenaria TaxID=6596 RepID=UPI00234FAEB3|nr:uncharacterized protein DDB_G0292642-like [Mercenaria mercenaria]